MQAVDQILKEIRDIISKISLIGFAVKRISDVYNGSAPLRQNVSNALPMRWQSHQGENIVTSAWYHWWHAGPYYFWFADLLEDGEPSFMIYHSKFDPDPDPDWSDRPFTNLWSTDCTLD